MPSPGGSRARAWLAHALGGLALAALLVAVLRPAAWASLPDFDKAYYPAGRKALAAPGTLYDAPVVDFVNVPLVALLFAPFAGLPAPRARLAFAALGALAVAVAAAALARLAGLGPWARATALLLLALNGPLHYSFQLGNLSHVLLPLLLAAFAADRAGREALAGGLLAVAALVKIPLALLALGFLPSRRWRALAAFAATAAGLAALSLLLFGPELHRVWFARCIRPFAEGPLAAYNVQSVDGFLARLLTEGGRQDFMPQRVGGAFHAVRLALLALLAGTVAVAYAGRRGGRGAATPDLAIALALALVVSPVSWSHYYVYLLLPLWFALAGWISVPRAAAGRALGLAGALLASLPVLPSPGRAGPALFAVYRWTAHSPHFAGGVLLLGALLWARREATRPLRR